MNRKGSKCVKIKCPKCGYENIIEIRRLTASSDSVKCSSCGEKIMVMGEMTVIFEE